jgi:hypothetical protein
MDKSGNAHSGFLPPWYMEMPAAYLIDAVATGIDSDHTLP